MRNETLTGYLLHQRPYQEKRALYYLFSQQYGVVHGVGKKGAPLFVGLHLFATGKRDLKTFSQINIMQTGKENIDNEQGIIESSSIENSNSRNNAVESVKNDPKSTNSLSYGQITGQNQYAALYLNEVLWRLLPTEDPMPLLWQHYQETLECLKQLLTAIELRLCLRQFEKHLFFELGFELTLSQDSTLSQIEPDVTYRFLPDVGLVPIQSSVEVVNMTTQAMFSGHEILSMVEQGMSETTLGLWSRLHRQLMDHLLDYQPLQSRLLWQQQQRYQR